jgi:hypothetical protein
MNDTQRTASVRSKAAQARKLAPPAGASMRVNWPKVLNDACRLIERDAPRLQELAVDLGVGRALSPSHRRGWQAGRLSVGSGSQTGTAATRGVGTRERDLRTQSRARNQPLMLSRSR